MTKHFFLLRRWLDLDMFLSLFWLVKRKNMTLHEIGETFNFQFRWKLLKEFSEEMWKKLCMSRPFLLLIIFFSSSSWQRIFLFFSYFVRIPHPAETEMKKKQENREKKKINEIIFSFSINSGWKRQEIWRSS